MKKSEATNLSNAIDDFIVVYKDFSYLILCAWDLRINLFTSAHIFGFTIWSFILTLYLLKKPGTV